jgi:DNA-binding PadR family transcriptional regulator
LTHVYTKSYIRGDVVLDDDLPAHWFQILLALADRDLHGLAITKDVFDRTDGLMHLWPGKLYGALKKMTDAGLVDEVEAPADFESGGGRPRFYRITAFGRRACASEAQRLARYVEAARSKRVIEAARSKRVIEAARRKRLLKRPGNA